MTERFKEFPYLERSFLSYFMLGATDTAHHLHAAIVLGKSNAIHAFWTGIVLLPATTLLVVCILYSGRKYCLWGYVSIAGLATLIPGFYHGGWDHLMKILAFLRISGQTTDIKSLFPPDNFNLWFYEITGSLEFIIAVLSALFLYKFMLKNR